MKNTSILLTGFLFSFLTFFTACSPQDPAVLTRDEKAAEQARRSGQKFTSNKGDGRSNSSGKNPVLSPDSDLAGVGLLLDTHSMIAGYLRLAYLFAEGSVNPLEMSCLKTTTVLDEPSKLSLAVDRVGCVTNSKTASLKERGRVQIEILRDDQKLPVEIKITSASSEQNSMLQMMTLLTKNQVRGKSAEIATQMNIHLKRVSLGDSTTFRVIQAVLTNVANLGPMDPENHVLKVQSWGDLVVSSSFLKGDDLLVKHNLTSVLRYDAKNTESQRTAYFDLSLEASPKKGVINQEIFSGELCGSAREVEYLVNFFYKPELTRKAHIVTEKSGEIKINDSKRPVSYKRPACSAKPGERAHVQKALPFVDWANVFLF